MKKATYCGLSRMGRERIRGRIRARPSPRLRHRRGLHQQVSGWLQQGAPSAFARQPQHSQRKPTHRVIRACGPTPLPPRPLTCLLRHQPVRLLVALPRPSPGQPQSKPCVEHSDESTYRPLRPLPYRLPQLSHHHHALAHPAFSAPLPPLPLLLLPPPPPLALLLPSVLLDF